MIDQGLPLLLLHLLLLGFNLLLLLDLSHVVFSLDPGLLSEGLLSLGELLLASHLEIGCDTLSLLLLEAFSLSGLSLAFLESPLGSQGINLGLSVSCFLLKLSESLDFSFLLVFDSLGLELGLVLFLVSCLLVLDDLSLLLLLLGESLFLLDQGLGIRFGGLLHQHIDSLPLDFCLLGILLLHLLDVGEQLESLLVSDFLLLHSFDRALLDLIDDHLGSLLASLVLSLLSLLLFLEDLESFDLHHEVEFLLLLDPFLLEALVFVKLLVADGDDLGVEDHLVHMLDVVEVVIELLLGFGEERLSLVLFGDLELRGLDLLVSLLVQFEHAGSAGLRLGHGGSLLLLTHLLFLNLHVFGFNSSGSLDPVKVLG